MASLHRGTTFLGASMINFSSVFNALNTVFGREVTHTIVKFGTDYVNKTNQDIRNTENRLYERIRKL